MNDHSDPIDGVAGGEPQAAAPSSAVSILSPVQPALMKRPALSGELSGSADRDPTNSGGGFASYLHAYRRRWFLATSIGILCGAAAAAAAWLCTTTNYTSTALIRIAADNQAIVYQIDKAESSFELYKGTQMQLLTSDFVLIAALRNPNVANLDILKREEDPVRWLAKALQVEAPLNAEILRVSLTTPDRSGGAMIVQAVVDAYQAEVADKERAVRLQRLAELDRVYAEQETELRSKRTELKKLAEQLGTGDKTALSVKEQFALQQYGDARTELNRLRAELQKTRYAIADNEAGVAAIKAGRQRPVTTAEIDNAVNNDAECIRLQQAVVALDDDSGDAKSMVKEDSSLAKSLDGRYARASKSLEDQLAARRKRLAEHLNAVRSGDPETMQVETQQLHSQATRLAQEEQQAAKEVEEQKKQTEMIGTSSIDVEMMRAELGELEKTFTAVADEREHVRVELNSQARISVVQAAAPPVAPDKSTRLQNSIIGGMFGFFAPVGLLLWWDVRARRINSRHDISRGLGLRVIGTVPHIKDASLSRKKLGSRRQRKRQIRLNHSIDGIAARLCLGRDSGNARVVLVSSATHGEGKSTLSIQLAKRLACTGVSTLLVDFDLRKPTLHHVFEVPRGPGLSEYLRGESELDTIIRTTPIENLSILTAGAPFSDSLGALANGVTRSLFEKFRSDFGFVVVDGSPILPVVDSLLASQHVDSVVLSIRRDVSQISRVQAAYDQLAQFGIEEIVAVLTGSNEDGHYDDNDHEHFAMAAADRRKPR